MEWREQSVWKPTNCPLADTTLQSIQSTTFNTRHQDNSTTSHPYNQFVNIYNMDASMIEATSQRSTT